MTGQGASEERDPSDNFVENMKLLRERKGWTQTELARRMVDAGWDKYTQMTVSRTEKYERPLRLDEAYLIAEILESDLAFMVQDPELAQRTQELERMTEYVHVVGADITNGIRTLLKTREDLGVKIERAEEAHDVPTEVVERAKRALDAGTADHYFEMGHKAFFDG